MDEINIWIGIIQGRDFWVSVLENLVAAPLLVVLAIFWFHFVRKGKFKKWGNLNIVPLWVFYLTLDHRFARIQKTIMRNRQVATGDENAPFDTGTSMFSKFSREDSISLALDLAKAEADSTCLLSYAKTWVSHASSISLPGEIGEAVLTLEEEITEFNASLIRHSRPLLELLRLLESGDSEEMLSKNRNGYFYYFLGGLDRTVSTVAPFHERLGDHSTWTLGNRLNKVKKAIQAVNESCCDGELLPEGSELWHENGNAFEAFSPIVSYPTS
jgi:hypothetical protein